jgi:cbb3-type cytochrome oxidase subunit 1
MRGISYWFYLVAALSVTFGMVWGIVMAISHDHTLSPAHAHLNLVGWVTMGLFGIYYHLVPESGARRLAKIHFAVATLGLVLLAPGIAIAILYDIEGFAAIGSLVTLASMLIFLFTVVRDGRGRKLAI